MSSRDIEGLVILAALAAIILIYGFAGGSCR